MLLPLFLEFGEEILKILFVISFVVIKMISLFVLKF